MRIILNETDRKPLATLLGEFMGTKPVYLRTPTYGYQIGELFLTKEGNIEGIDNMSRDEFDDLLNCLDAGGYRPEEIDFLPEEKSDVQEFPAEENDTDESQSAAESFTKETGLSIKLPLDSVQVENLTNLLEAKGGLIKHALQIDDLPFKLGKETIAFPWFPEMPEPDEVQAYSTFLSAICKMTREQKRINKVEKPVSNEKYAFRCFLLRLGFIGDEYKTERKILLRHLSGSSAFRDGRRREVETCE